MKNLQEQNTRLVLFVDHTIVNKLRQHHQHRLDNAFERYKQPKSDFHKEEVSVPSYSSIFTREAVF